MSKSKSKSKEVVNGSLNEVELEVKVDLNDELLKGDGVLEDMGAAEIAEVKEILDTPSEVKGETGSEDGSSEEGTTEVSDAAPAEADSEGGDDEEVAVEEVVSLPVVYFTFDEAKDRVELVIDVDFQLDLRELCNKHGKRPTAFEAEGELSPQELLLLTNVIK